LAGILTNLEENDVLFIDEIHRLSPIVEEYLYSAMEDYKIDIMLETGPNARSVQIGLNPFTLIGATTRSGMLTKPMLARFGIQSRLEYYTVELLGMIIERSARVLGVPIYEDAALEIARRSRGTPRIANALLRRVRDFAEIKGNGEIEIAITKFALDSLNVDEFGLDDMDNKIMRVMIENFKSKPVGISALATSIGENPETLEEVYEPYLIQEGFIIRTPRGREVTEKAYKHLNIVRPKSPGELF
jgi:Holliday junction DNA helicase RuvB